MKERVAGLPAEGLKELPTYELKGLPEYVPDASRCTLLFLCRSSTCGSEAGSYLRLIDLAGLAEGLKELPTYGELKELPEYVPDVSRCTFRRCSTCDRQGQSLNPSPARGSAPHRPGLERG